MKNFLKNVFHSCAVVLSRSAFISKVSQRIADYHKGNNNLDMATNGELSFLKKHVQGIKIAFDIGANQGDWTREALKLVPSADIIAFEPDPHMYSIFHANIFPKNVTCENMGLGSKRGTLTLYVNKKSSGMNSFVKRAIFNENELIAKEVPVTTIDAYCAEKGIKHIDFMKVDVEGFELDVLRGAERMIREKSISVIQFEYGGTYLDSQISLKDIFELFQGMAYSIYKLLPSEAVAIAEYSPELEDFQYSNYLAIAQ